MAKKLLHRLNLQAVYKARIRFRVRRTASVSEPSLTGVESAKQTPSDGAKTLESQKTKELIATPSHTAEAGQPRDRNRMELSRELISQILRGARRMAMPMFWLSVAAFCGGTGWAAFLWLTTLPPLPDCQQLSSFATDNNKLYCAEQAVRSGKEEAFLAGLDLVKQWTGEHPLRIRAKQLLKDWSIAILDIARQKAAQNDLAGAIALARKVPLNSPMYAQAKGAIASWKQDQQQDQIQEAKLETALKVQDWKTADAEIQTLAKLDTPYWRRRINALRQRVITERIAFQQLRDMQQLASSAAGNPDKLGRIVVLAEQISPDSYARPAVEDELKRLSQSLLHLMLAKVAQSDIEGAIATARQVPASIPLPPEAHDLVWLSRAQPLVTRAVPQQPISVQIWQLWTVLLQMRQIGATSPLSAQVKILMPQLEQQIQDLTQLQLASATANLKQIPALQIAIHMAEGITLDRPQRLYAQTLIADWRDNIQRAEDYPYLLAAQQWAKTGTIPHLNVAIALAGKIPLGRALRPEAQAAIFDWTQQIQTMQDQPVLIQAQTLGQQKKLKDAIQMAAKIRPGRALYLDAQTAIKGWTAQVQTAEDRPILNQANVLADQGSLSAAINLASQIGDGRALSGEAKMAIARWAEEREEIERSRRLAANSSRHPKTAPPRSPDRDESPPEVPDAPDSPPP